MTTLTATTRIAAPPERCFRLSLTLELEIEAMRSYGLTPVSGTTHGEIKAGERVTWEVRQFGLRIRHTTEISQYDPPGSFQDRMIQGVFACFSHDHSFIAADDPGWTVMQDTMTFSMPWYLGGSATEFLLVKRRMRHLLDLRNQLIRQRAEMRQADR